MCTRPANCPSLTTIQVLELPAWSPGLSLNAVVRLVFFVTAFSVVPGVYASGPLDSPWALVGAMVDGTAYLTWNAPLATYGDVIGYRVYRSMDYANFSAVANVTDLRYEDTAPGVAYYVTARHASGTESDSSNRVVFGYPYCRIVGAAPLYINDQPLNCLYPPPTALLTNQVLARQEVPGGGPSDGMMKRCGPGPLFSPS
jgi:hypothetical protein